MSSMGGHTYTSLQPGLTLSTSNPETPYSAVCSHNICVDRRKAFSRTDLISPQVSSFNLPATYDASLVTPVSMSASPSTSRATTSLLLKQEKPIKMSPTSPTYLEFPEDDGFGSSRFHNEPMKFKDPPNSLYVSSPDSPFPAAPYPEPFFGNFGVSAPTGGTRNSASLPPRHPSQSPNLNSAGGLSNDSRNSRHPTPIQGSSYRSNQTPILIAPNPASLRKDSSIYRENSLQSTNSHNSTPHSQGPHQMPFSHHQHENHMLSSSDSKKRKTPDSGLEQHASGIVYMSEEEQLLLRLTEQEQLPWKDVMSRFNEETGRSMKVPALQMRKKRLLERIRVWNDTEVVKLHSSTRCYPPSSPFLQYQGAMC
jgi:hypothetical protein